MTKLVFFHKSCDFPKRGFVLIRVLHKKSNNAGKWLKELYANISGDKIKRDDAPYVLVSNES